MPRRIAAALLLAFGCGLALGRALAPGGAPAPAERAEPSALRGPQTAKGALARERAERLRLAAELAKLQQAFDLLAAVSATDGGDLPVGPDASSTRSLAQARSGAGGAAFDEEALLRAGLRVEDAERLRELWGRVEMEKAALAVRAAAEGWSDTYRHHRALRRIDEALRRELEEEDYDGFLYASRRPNRLVVRQVIGGTAAADAGLLPGDAILRYEGQRVFDTHELDALVSGGPRGEMIRLEVLRRGEELSFVVPREPLGVVAGLTVDRPRLR